MPKITQQRLEAHLMGAANILRGRTAGQDYKTYILTLLFFKRLSDQWDFEAEAVIREKEREFGRTFSEAQRQAILSSGNYHRFDIPDGCHWADVAAVAENIGEVPTRATKGIAGANPELTGVFTVDWNQPAPDGKDKLIPNQVVSALVQHFGDAHFNLSNAHVEPDILGRAYEYLIKYFADDAGAKAGEFFTPPEVVDILIRCLEPKPGETVYDPTCGSGGMLVHSADFLKEQGHRPEEVRYFGQEMNWQTYAIAKINLLLHGLEGDVRGGRSTLTEPQHVRPDGGIERFDVVIANFPFSDSEWFLPESQRTEEQIKKAKKTLALDGFKDKFERFTYGQPPASNGDFAFIQHIVASANASGRCGVVCPQGVLFRGQPEIEEETDEFDAKGNPKIRRRKADDEYLIRRGLLEAGMVDAVIALPLNIFYGAGVPACLLLLNKNRPAERAGKTLLVYAARHFRELSAQNKLRPQDVMRILVHYHAFGDAGRAERLVGQHSGRLQDIVTRTEAEDVLRLTAEYQVFEDDLKAFAAERERLEMALVLEVKGGALATIRKKVTQVEKAMERPTKRLAERDEKIAEVRKRADEDRRAIHEVAEELRALYADPAELAKHARVVEWSEIEENECNLNIPRYVDTFEPEEPVDVNTALAALDKAEAAKRTADQTLRLLLEEIGYATK